MRNSLVLVFDYNDANLIKFNASKIQVCEGYRLSLFSVH